MTKIVGRIVDGVATTEVDLIPEKECPRCRKPIKKRVHYCEFCEYCDTLVLTKDAVEALEARLK